MLQALTLVVLVFGIYMLDRDAANSEKQILIWLDDAEKDRAEQTVRIRSIETFLMKRTDYIQTQ